MVSKISVSVINMSKCQFANSLNKITANNNVYKSLSGCMSCIFAWFDAMRSSDFLE